MCPCITTRYVAAALPPRLGLDRGPGKFPALLKTRYYLASLGPVDLNLIKSSPIPVTAQVLSEIRARPYPGACI